MPSLVGAAGAVRIACGVPGAPAGASAVGVTSLDFLANFVMCSLTDLGADPPVEVRGTPMASCWPAPSSTPESGQTIRETRPTRSGKRSARGTPVSCAPSSTQPGLQTLRQRRLGPPLMGQPIAGRGGNPQSYPTNPRRSSLDARAAADVPQRTCNADAPPEFGNPTPTPTRRPPTRTPVTQPP